MYCPHCNENIDELATFDYMYEWVECPDCHIAVWIDYEEIYDEDNNEEWQLWEALTYDKYEQK